MNKTKELEGQLSTNFDDEIDHSCNATLLREKFVVLAERFGVYRLTAIIPPNLIYTKFSGL